MKKILLFTFLVFSFLVFGQKIKFKKGVVLADEKPVFYYTDDTSLSATVSTLKNVEFVSILGNVIPGISGSYIYVVRFLKSGKELMTDLDYRSIVKNLYTANIVDENGEINEDKVNQFINKFDNQNLKNKLIVR